MPVILSWDKERIRKAGEILAGYALPESHMLLDGCPFITPEEIFSLHEAGKLIKKEDKS